MIRAIAELVFAIAVLVLIIPPLRDLLVILWKLTEP